MSDDEDTSTGGANAMAEKNTEGMSELDLLRECLKEQTKVAKINADAIVKLSEAMKGLTPIPVVAPTAEEVRNSKFEKLYMLWLKQSKFKEFKHSDNVDVSQWLLQLDSTVSNLASAACNLDLVNQPLKSCEFGKLLRYRLSFSAEQEITQALEAAHKTWDNATSVEIRTAMKQLYQKREPQMSSLLKLFSADRFKKGELSCTNFFAKFKESLPTYLVCKTNDEFKNFYDLAMRAAYYMGLDDDGLQRELSKIPEEDQSLQKNYEESCAAESRTKHYKDTQSRGHALDNSTNVNVAKSDTKVPKGRGKGKWHGSNEYVKDNSSAHSNKAPSNASGHHQNYADNKQKPSSQNHSNSKGNNDSGAKSKKENVECYICHRKGHFAHECKECYNCHNKGHFAHECRKPGGGAHQRNTANDNRSDNRKVEISSEENGSSNGNYFMKKLDVTPVVSPRVLAVNAVQTGPPLPVIKASFIVEGRYICDFEIDTDASHTTIPPSVFRKAQYVATNKPTLGQEQTMRLADGSLSDNKCRLTHLSLARADKPYDTATFPVMVCKGPNVILGRSAIKYFWPHIYDKLSKAAASTREAADAIPASPPEVLDSLCGIASISAEGDSSTSGDTSYESSKTHNPSSSSLSSSESESGVTQEEGERKCLEICKSRGFPELFDGKQGLFRGVEARIYLKEGHEQYLKVRPTAKVPHGYKEPYKKALDKMMLTYRKVDGIGLRIASQLVPVVKPKENEIVIRLCGNYKSTLNEHIEDELYNSPTCNEQLDKLKGEMYSVLDMSGAYEQIALHPETAYLLTVVTPEGYAVPTRLPYGVKTAPMIFQSHMDRLIHGKDGKGPIPNCVCVVDDICVTGATPAEHFGNLTELLSRLHSAGLKLNPKKCKFYQKEVKFLGKIIDRSGQRLDPSSVAAIVNMPQPKDKQTLRSFLGHMSYVGKHIPDLRIARAPLDTLLKAEEKFVWTSVQNEGFENCKKMASSAATLVHYDDKLPLVLTTDASPVGLGACLSHKITEDGKTLLKPIYYASCSLKPCETRYAQVDREGLGVYWAIKYFRQFLLGRFFELHTDCSALKRIYGPKNDLGGCASGRLNRWAVALSDYNFKVVHISGNKNSICDSLSRLPVGSFATVNAAQCLAQLPEEKSYCEVSICSIVGNPITDPWNTLPVSVKDVAKVTREDRVYGKLLQSVRAGQLDNGDGNLKQFVSIFQDLHIEQDVIFFGSRIVIPTALQDKLLQELHQTHMSAVKMKETSRRYFWWPKITSQIDVICKQCIGCAKYRRKPAAAPVCPWPFARRPMERVHIDYAEYKGKNILIMIDAYSKYIWAANMNADTTTFSTLVKLYEWFGECSGYPTTLVSDNGRQFASKEFQQKMEHWNIKHLFSPPYHPASNGLAEKAVHIVKDKLKKNEISPQPLQLRIGLAQLLRIYRLTVHSATGETPYDLHRKANSPNLFPNLQLRHSDVTVTTPIPKCKTFEVGEYVLVYDKMTKISTVGKVLSKISNSSYSVVLEGITKHIAIDNMSKTVIKDNSIRNDKVDDSISVSSELDSDNESIMSDFSGLDDYEGLQPQQQVGVTPSLQPAVPRRSPKKTRTGRKY